jgi:Leucine-rich repeat (LRR) protein
MRLHSLINLQVLNLHKNQLEGAIPVMIGELKEIKVLDLSFNKLLSNSNSICEMTNLKDLKLYMNTLSGVLPQQIGL